MKEKIGGLRELALFAGGGGGILGGRLLGWRTVCAVEFAPYARSVLLARQRDGHLDPFPIWDDVRTFDGRPWRGSVDVVSGGFPCQDISAAGRGAGIEGARSGLWGEMARIIGEVRPSFALVENSPMLTSRGLGVVLGDLAAMGYDARWGVLGARHVGAPHKRDRIWVVAHAVQKRSQRHGNKYGLGKSCEQREVGGGGDDGATEYVADAQVPDDASSSSEKRYSKGTPEQLGRSGGVAGCRAVGWWQTEPGLGRVADGVANRVDRLKALGNGQVPAVVELAWRILGGGQ